MKEGNVTLDELAAKLDQFGYDFDSYGYMDAVETREEVFEQIREELRKGHIPGFREYLKEVVEEEGNFAGEAEDILRLMDRYESRGKLTHEQKQSILDRIEELSKHKPAPAKESCMLVKEDMR